MLLRFLLSTTAIALGLQPLSAQQTNLNLTEVVTAAPPPFGLPQGVAVAGSTVFVAIDAGGLLVMDVSNPAQPKQVGHFPEKGIRGVRLNGDRLYGAKGTNGIVILDVSVPSIPVRIGGTDTAGSAVNIAPHGSFAFVADSAAGVQVLNTADPANPTVIGTYDTSGSAVTVTVQNNLLYVGDSAGGMLVLDIADPANLQLRGKYNVSCTDVVISQDLAYLACGSSGMHQVNIADPANPALVKAFPVLQGARRLSLLDEKLYVARGTFGLHSVDLTDPLQPVVSANVSPVEDVRTIVADGSLLFGTSSFAFKVFNGATPNPAKLSEYKTVVSPLGLTVAGNLGFLSALDFGLQIVDLDDPLAPKYRGRYSTSAFSTAVQGNLAIVAGYTNGLHILDISDPSNPTLISRIPTQDTFYDAHISGEIVFAAEATRGVRILDISNPASPTTIFQLDTPGTAFEIIVENSIAYIADMEGLLQIFDVSNPRNPVRLSGWTSPQPAFLSVQQIAKRGNFLFVGDRNLRIQDVSNPRSPSGLWGDQGGRVSNVTVSSNRMIVSRGSQVTVFDVSDETRPLQIAAFQAMSPFETVARDNFIFLADQSVLIPHGLRILKFDTTPAIFARPISLLTRSETRTLGWHSEGVASPDWSLSSSGPSQPSLRMNGPIRNLGEGNWEVDVEVLNDAAFSCEHRFQITDSKSGAQGSALFCVDALPTLAFGLNDGDVFSSLVVGWPAKYSEYFVYTAPTVNGPWSFVGAPYLLADTLQMDIPISQNGIFFTNHTFVRLKR